MNILVVSESFVIRDSIGNLFQRVFQPCDIKVVSKLDNLDNKELARLDFAFIDVKKEHVEVSEILTNIKNVFKRLKILVFDINRDTELFLELCRMGIDGYILNISEEDEFIYIVRKIINGKKYYDSEILQDVINKPINTGAQNLTHRELDVLKQVARGFSNKDIAQNLNVTDYTIKKHVSKILSKLNLRNRQDIVIYAKDNKILENNS